MAKQTQKNIHKVRTLFDEKTRFKGKLRYKHSLQINGSFDGSIDSPGLLFVESGALVRANIRVGTLIVSGRIEGNVHADESLEVRHNGSIKGNIATPSLVIHDDTEIQGNVKMLKDYSDVDIFSGSLEQLKNSVTGVK